MPWSNYRQDSGIIIACYGAGFAKAADNVKMKECIWREGGVRCILHFQEWFAKLKLAVSVEHDGVLLLIAW